jgi:CRISPR-associated exonuclease Cas4
VRIARSLQLRSFALGLYGIADIVEFRQPAATPFPVEYKRGKPKDSPVDRVQLCAQALCLEEMLNIAVPCGALYYGRTRHRLDVAFDEPLRSLTLQTARDLHTLLSSGRTPPALREDKCDHCSLLNICMPRGPRQPRSAAAFIAQAIAARTVPGGPEDSQ